jgi:hypothetical protein
MKKILLLSTFLLSSTLFAETNVQWSDLEISRHYTLNQDIVFDGGVTFKAGESFQMTDFNMGGVPVIYYQMHANDCKNPEQTTGMILVDGTDNVVFGAQLSEDCNLDLFIEPIDYYKESIFTE